METITQSDAQETILLQCEVPSSLMRRIRIAAAKLNSRAIKPVVIAALEAYVPFEEPEPKRKRAS